MLAPGSDPRGSIMSASVKNRLNRNDRFWREADVCSLLVGIWTISEGYFALNLRCVADHSSSEVVLLTAGSESTGNGKQLLQLQHGAIRCREDRPARRLGDQRRRWRHAVLREGNQVAVAQIA